MNWLVPARRTFEQQRRWTQSIESVRRGWSALLLAVTVLVVAGVLVLLLPGSALLKGLVAGVLFASAIWAPFTAVTVRTYSATVGAWGESFTRELLKRERPEWPVVHDIPMASRNIDHVAVSPRAVLAIETKFLGAGSPWSKHPYRAKFLNDTRQSAKSLHSLLRSRNVELPLPVDAVLVLWGPGAPMSEGAWTESEGVIVVSGQHGSHWLRNWSTGEISSDQGQTVKARLERFQATRRKHDRGKKTVR